MPRTPPAPSRARPWARPWARSWALALASALSACGAGDDPSDPAQTPPSRGSVATSDASSVLDTASVRRREHNAEQWRNPSTDGWDTEVLSDRIGEQLHHLGEWILDPRALAAEGAAQLAVPGLELAPLRPGELEIAYQDEQLHVARGSAAASEAPVPFVDAVRSLTAGLEPAGQGSTKFKIIRVEPEGDRVSITTHYEMLMPVEDGRVEHHGTWRMGWRMTGGEGPLLFDAAVLSHEEVTTHAPAGSLFVDSTLAVIGDDPCFEPQLSRGHDHWARHIENTHGMGLFRKCGAAVGDVDGDGLEDLYLCQPGGLPNRLFVQQTDGTARDRSAESGVDLLDLTTSALLVDLDDDGDADLVLATPGVVVVFANDGHGRFSRATNLPTADNDVYALSAVDFDLDGHLDLYVTFDFAQRSKGSGPRVRFDYVDANDGGANHLFRGRGRDLAFEDVTEAVGLEVANRRHSLAAAWEDFDLDGDPDLYVANDYGQNCLYRNDAGHFVEVAAELGVTDHGSGMSAHWGDYDRDGRWDLYVGNMFSSAGNRITTQARFMPDVNEQTRALYRRFAKGNTLFRQQADGTFAEVSGQADVEMGRWAWGSVFVDFNNDGWQDILVANGYITTEDTGDL